jgi:Pathogenicity locus
MGSRFKAPNALSPSECERLEQLPNIGPALAADLRLLGIQQPQELVGRDAFALYQQLCQLTAKRHDPCVLDTFMAATAFMAGEPPAPWWHYTPQRKLRYGPI